MNSKKARVAKCSRQRGGLQDEVGVVAGVQITKKFVSQRKKCGLHFAWEGKPLLGLCRELIRPGFPLHKLTDGE